MTKKLLTSLLAIVALFGIAAPAFAASYDMNWSLQDSGDSTVPYAMSIPPNNNFGIMGVSDTTHMPFWFYPGAGLEWNGTSLVVSGVPASNITGLGGILDTINASFATTTSAITTIQSTLMGIGGSGGSVVQTDWSEASTTATDFIKNKPSLSTVATSGAYSDLSGKPLIQSGSCTTDGSGNCTVTFGTTFSGTPKVAVTAIQSTTGTLTNAQVTSKSTSAVTIHVNTLATVLGLLTLTSTASGIVVDVVAMP